MTQTANLFLLEFQSLCADFGVDPAVALENEQVRQAIKARSWGAIRKALETYRDKLEKAGYMPN